MTFCLRGSMRSTTRGPSSRGRLLLPFKACSAALAAALSLNCTVPQPLEVLAEGLQEE